LWVVVGLGNPGRKYAKTRHNIGFMVADDLSERYGIELRERALYRSGRGSVEGSSVILVEPLTFMNRSGFAVKDVMKRYNVDSGKLIVIHDDIDMEAGKLKIRRKGSSGGHKGVESIIREMGTREFIRVKLGVGRDEGLAVEDYVLRKFRKEESSLVKDAITGAAEAVVVIITEGINKAMNEFN
jgi:PTH1 family peptidyl-tRNA hydrolase